MQCECECHSKENIMELNSGGALRRCWHLEWPHKAGRHSIFDATPSANPWWILPMDHSSFFFAGWTEHHDFPQHYAPEGHKQSTGVDVGMAGIQQVHTIYTMGGFVFKILKLPNYLLGSHGPKDLQCLPETQACLIDCQFSLGLPTRQQFKSPWLAQPGGFSTLLHLKRPLNILSLILIQNVNPTCEFRE